MARIFFYSLIIACMAVVMPLTVRSRHHKKLSLIVLFIYILANLSFTLLFREPSSRVKINMEWMRALNKAFELESGSFVSLFSGGFPVGIRLVSWEPLELTILNILLYIPMGYLLQFAFPHLKPRYILLIGFLSSLLTETAQLAFRLGLCELDDMIFNTLGTVLGLALYALSKCKNTNTP